MKLQKNKQNVRLGSVVIPIHYQIILEPDLLAHTFKGEETIMITLAKQVREITLHSKDLKIMSATISFGTQSHTAKKISYDSKRETATFLFDQVVPKGKAKLHLTFAGILRDNMRGFYKSRYEVNGQERFMATTQFEATDARRCIPCFDEPAQKAVFQVSLIVPPDKVAISNTLPTDVREHASGFNIVSFAPTPKMSTYLLAFIVGDFEYLEKKTKTGVIVRVYTVPGKKHQAEFALSCAVKCLEFYNDYFDIPYPLNTLDMIAVPDFSSGAMENWGAVTYRETAILVDPEHSSTQTKQWVALVVAHELAHQWFGNLVTMEWWTHLWLNEGFASYIEYLAVDRIFPKWNIWTRFLYGDHGPALRLDALKHTHPIEVEVHHPNEIGEIFDEISYSKGSAVIRMLANYLGKDDFKEGLRYYLKKHMYKNAGTVHLWQAFEKVSGKPVEKMMTTWTKRPGYPIVRIREQDAHLHFSQERFFASPLSRREVTDTTLWNIPISFTGPRRSAQQFLMTKKNMIVPRTPGSWLKFNTNETGLYRVRYDASLLDQLRQPIKDNQLPADDRFGIIRDLYALSEAGDISAVVPLSMLPSYSNEPEYMVWVEAVSGLGRINNLYAGSSYEEPLRTFARSIFAPAVKLIGWKPTVNESHSHALLRSLLLGSAGAYGDTKVIAKAQSLFMARNRLAIPSDLRSVVYSIIARYGGEKEYNALLLMHQAASLHEEKNRIESALGHFTDPRILNKVLAYSISSSVRLQDRNGLIAGVILNPRGRKIAWTFIKKNWSKLSADYGEGWHLMSRMISPLGRATTKQEADDIKKFFKTHKAPGAARTIEQVLEQININHAWRIRDEKALREWLKK